MNARSFPLCIALLLATIGMVAVPTSRALAADNEATAIRQVLATQQADWNRGDVVAFMRGYKDSPETTFVGAKVRKGFQAILQSYKKNYASKAQMGTLTFSEVDVRLLPCADGHTQYAAVTGHFHLDRTLRGAAAKDDGVFSLLWEKTGDGWKVILDHTS
jgi:uncharacterized protein (TIGR02246 family)